MNTHQSAYEAAFAKLNEGQRQAVLATEGPVMVLAGPGTGKTQVLATRIGYILDNTDTNPQNILCLTFTDAGVVAMRERLVKFIGKEAYKVNIHTFHSFCNMVIQANTEYFTQNFQLNVADDLQKKEIVRKMIDLLPVDDVNKRLKNAFYLDENKYMSLFSEMKRENISTEQIEADGQFVMQRVEDFEDMVYLRKSGENNKGDKKLKDIAKIREGVGKLVAASRQLETYNALLAEDGLYDYDDMINWVVNAFERDENLLLDY
ncbi:MAG TPA: UvrD-helicase domain-containing protein, partial [Saprospiraceae bacterium]|nr:UvrD-helicase domain-containing protein [Saprospiraceae bacterium]